MLKATLVCAHMWCNLQSVPMAFPDTAHSAVLNVGLPGRSHLLVELQSC